MGRLGRGMIFAAVAVPAVGAAGGWAQTFEPVGLGGGGGLFAPADP